MKLIDLRKMKELPVGAAILWGIALTFAVIGITMVILELFGVIGDHHMAETILCCSACVINAVFLNKYKDIING